MKDVYAIATVVGREAPVSSHLGDRAVIDADGTMQGFVGGSCAREIVRSQAIEAIRAGEPRLVRIRPHASATTVERDTVTIPMQCISEGAVDVYIEPHLPKRALIIVGDSPVAHALAQLAPALDFEVAHLFDADEVESRVRAIEPWQRARSFAIVASQGHYDERALMSVLSVRFAFVGLLASPKRAAAIREVLLQQGASSERVKAIHAPVGVPIGARKPAEVAVAILAQIVESIHADHRAAEADETAGEMLQGSEHCPHCHASTEG